MKSACCPKIFHQTAVHVQNPHHARPTSGSAEAQVNNAVQDVVVRIPNVLTGILLLKKRPVKEPCFFRTRFLRRKPKMQSQEKPLIEIGNNAVSTATENA
jgi:hypothetical protein